MEEFVEGEEEEKEEEEEEEEEEDKKSHLMSCDNADKMDSPPNSDTVAPPIEGSIRPLETDTRPSAMPTNDHHHQSDTPSSRLSPPTISRSLSGPAYLQCFQSSIAWLEQVIETFTKPDS